MNEELRRILPRVQKPARYTGGEYGETVKNPDSIDVRIALCFPDTYEIGMSNLGLQILYALANKEDGIWCERVFAPWPDMAAELKNSGLGLYGLESGDDIRNFDIIAFSLGYEMAFVNMLTMLNLSGIPLRSQDREALTPLVICGGVCCYNPAPIAPFADLFLIGEGEELNLEVYAAYRGAKKNGLSKSGFLKIASGIPGVYVPGISSAPVLKRIVSDFNRSFFPVKAVIPSTEIVQDRVSLELFRGCIRGCRFCQAGYTNRPVRARKHESAASLAIKALEHSGYEEVTLSSLSTSDYKEIGALCDGLLEYTERRHISLSLPSLRADNFSMQLMRKVQRVRKSSLTFAPEAGTQRLRDVINKNVTDEELFETLRIAFEGGYERIKLYFMLGLPSETDEDVLGIADIARRVSRLYKENARVKRRGLSLNVSTSCFVPKPHTPFQWFAQISREEYLRRVILLREQLRIKGISYSWHSPETSFIEGVLARGDERLAQVLEQVVQNGGSLESWEEYFSFSRWTKAFEDCGIDPDDYTRRERDENEVFPWDIISTGVDRSFLRREYENAAVGVTAPNCFEQCSLCGVHNTLCGGHCLAR